MTVIKKMVVINIDFWTPAYKTKMFIKAYERNQSLKSGSWPCHKTSSYRCLLKTTTAKKKKVY